MSRVIVKAKHKVNPYTVGRYAIIAGVYIILYGLTALFIVLTVVTSAPDVVSAWSLAATLFSIFSLVATGIGLSRLYDHFENREAWWTPYQDGRR